MSSPEEAGAPENVTRMVFGGLIIATACTPECGPIRVEYDVRDSGTRLWHGDNAEHTMLLEDMALVRVADGRAYAKETIERWLAEVHEWERDPLGFMDAQTGRQQLGVSD